MKKIFGLIVLFYSVACFSSESINPSALVGEWVGQRCQSYNDSTTIGVYSFNFKASGEMVIYIQHYEGSCAGTKGMISQVATGSYEILSSTENNEQIMYELSLHYSHNSEQPRLVKAIVNGNTLRLCRQSGYCSSYLRNQ